MKNLIGAAAPTQRIFRSFKFLMLVVLVTFGFTSCKDQTKSNVSPESEFTTKSDFQEAESITDIGGNQVPPGGFCECASNPNADKTVTIGGIKDDTGQLAFFDIGGGKDAGGGPGKHDILSPSSSEISRKSSTLVYAFSAIGGRGGVEPPGGIDINLQPSTTEKIGCMLRDY